ncbi:MAG: peptidase [Betaproteobacteria bacterium RIFCSPLOWO2_02_FULL_62_17]|nr:MAG: peptidase [Betaproteobacteria bacterium RIFCSPLOWO2_02_FULL_62_17]
MIRNLLTLAMLASLLGISAPALAQAPAPALAARAWLLVDVAAGQTLAAQNAEERVEPASLTKLMTAYIVFTALKEKRLTLEQPVPVSERAWRAGGSRMFIDPRKPVNAGELIQGMIIQSGNDACIALAEAIAGTEEAFAQIMNREAKRLGMNNTQYTNSSGLPDARHYTTARDLAILAATIIREFPDQYRYYAVREFRYNNITQQNRNRLLWLDPNVDGMKTGYTEGAGYCLIASSRRGTRRLLSVVLGASSESLRAQESQKLLNYGFLFFDQVRLYEKSVPVSALPVWKGSENTLKAGVAEDLRISVPKGMGEKLKAELLSLQPLVAPISAGQRVGTIRVSLDGKPVGEYAAVALQNVAVAGIFGRAWDTMRLWFQ